MFQIAINNLSNKILNKYGPIYLKDIIGMHKISQIVYSPNYVEKIRQRSREDTARPEDIAVVTPGKSDSVTIFRPSENSMVELPTQQAQQRGWTNIYTVDALNDPNNKSIRDMVQKLYRDYYTIGGVSDKKTQTDSGMANFLLQDPALVQRLDVISNITYLQFQQSYIKTIRAQGGGTEGTGASIYGATKNWFDDLIKRKKMMMKLVETDMLREMSVYDSKFDRDQTLQGPRQVGIKGNIVNWITAMLGGTAPAVAIQDIYDQLKLSPLFSGGRVQGLEPWQKITAPELLIGPDAVRNGYIPFQRLSTILRTIDGSLDYTDPKKNAKGFVLLSEMFWMWKKMFIDNLNKLSQKDIMSILDLNPEADKKFTEQPENNLGVLESNKNSKFSQLYTEDPEKLKKDEKMRRWLEDNVNEKKLRKMLAPTDETISEQIDKIPLINPKIDENKYKDISEFKTDPNYKPYTQFAPIQNVNDPISAPMQPTVTLDKNLGDIVRSTFSDKDLNDRWLVPSSQNAGMPLKVLAVEGLQIIASQELNERQAGLLFSGNTIGGLFSKIKPDLVNMLRRSFGVG